MTYRSPAGADVPMLAGPLSEAQTYALTVWSYPLPGFGLSETLTARPCRASNVVFVVPETVTLRPPTVAPPSRASTTDVTSS
ncbi:hypothetical protein ACQ4WX_28195 [Streptomyces lasalocidi]